PPALHSFPTRRSSDLTSFIGQNEADLLMPRASDAARASAIAAWLLHRSEGAPWQGRRDHGLHHSLALGMRFNLNGAERSASISRSEEHTSELQSRENL